MITASILADSRSPAGTRLTTFRLSYPRFVHAELMTHRAFSRNSASSRAIPVAKVIQAVLDTPAMPIVWGTNQPGMQAGAPLDPERAVAAAAAWRHAARAAVEHARALMALGVHKQIANRVLEPFVTQTTLVTATEWENFFALRADPDAQPEFQALADLMLDAYITSTPQALAAGEWHIPFGDLMPSGLTLEDRLRVATARCARVSYLTFDGIMHVERDFELHDRLACRGHWSPFEHSAQALDTATWSGNVRGFQQYRKCFPDENRRIDLVALAAARRRRITA